jgi:hypothetical protein
MASASSLERIEEIQEEIRALMSDTEEKEDEVGKDLATVEEKVDYLEENASDSRINNETEEILEIFIETCNHLAEDLKAEKEIRQEIEKLEEDEKTYTQLLNRIQSQDLPEGKRRRVQSLVGKIPRGKVEEAIKEDKKLEKSEEASTREQIERLDQVYEHLRFNVKSRGVRSEIEDAREAWVQLTHLQEVA